MNNYVLVHYQLQKSYFMCLFLQKCVMNVQNRNVLELYSEPFNVRGIVCMTNETKGMVNEYNKYGIKYIQLNTLDTTPPSVENVLNNPHAQGVLRLDPVLKDGLY